jgi:hypothetical protein
MSILLTEKNEKHQLVGKTSSYKIVFKKFSKILQKIYNKNTAGFF